ncbi:MAG: DUF2683 family protein [Candidatus Diapherotrites archaeon]|nr:DUF2683 family protein [Candidatus Diapherotrites archaeon]
MPVAIVRLKERTNRVINVVKAKYGLRDKSSAIDKLAEGYEEEVLEPPLRPEYIEKLNRIGKTKSLGEKTV